MENGIEIRSGKKIAIKIIHPKSALDGEFVGKARDEIYDAMAKSMLDEILLLKARPPFPTNDA